MPSREDWIVGGVIAAVFVAIGVTVFVFSRKKSSGYTLKKIAAKEPVLTNLERVSLVRDRQGNLSELIIHREIRD